MGKEGLVFSGLRRIGYLLSAIGQSVVRKEIIYVITLHLN
jgi:hypothetical protein